jgi:hypothetical protein
MKHHHDQRHLELLQNKFNVLQQTFKPLFMLMVLCYHLHHFLFS